MQAFVPRLLAFLVIMFIGWLIAKALVYYAVLLIALQMAFGVFGTNPVSTMLTGIVAFLPRAVVAIVIVVAAGAVARAVRDLVTGALGGLSYGSLLGIIAALNQMGVATSVTTPVLITALATVGGIAVIGVGGGLVRPMQQRWENWLHRAEDEIPHARAAAEAFQRGKEDAGRTRGSTGAPMADAGGPVPRAQGDPACRRATSGTRAPHSRATHRRDGTSDRSGQGRQVVVPGHRVAGDQCPGQRADGQQADVEPRGGAPLCGARGDGQGQAAFPQVVLDAPRVAREQHRARDGRAGLDAGRQDVADRRRVLVDHRREAGDRRRGHQPCRTQLVVEPVERTPRGPLQPLNPHEITHSTIENHQRVYHAE